MAGHLEAHKVDGAAVIQRQVIGSHGLTSDQDSLRLQVGASVEEGLGDNDGGRGTVGGRTALEFG